MAITNYGELKTAVANWLERDDLTDRIPEFIAFGEATLYTDLRVREMEASDTIITTGAQRSDALPTRFVQARDLYIAGAPDARLEFRSPAEYWSVYSSIATGKPAYYTIVGENVLWAPVPDDQYSVVVDHYARPAAFSGDTDTNAVLARWPNLFLYAAMVHAMPYIANDARVAGLAALYQEQVAQAHDADRRDRYSGDPVMPARAGQMT